jgi:hypothetical protein
MSSSLWPPHHALIITSLFIEVLNQRHLHLGPSITSTNFSSLVSYVVLGLVLLELGWGGCRYLLAGPFLIAIADPYCSLSYSYVVLGLVLLELGWAGVGISWLAIFCQRTKD